MTSKRRRHRVHGAVALLLLSGGLRSAALAGQPATGDLLIEHVRVFDPVGGIFSAPTDLLIRGNRIEATGDVGPAGAGVVRLDAAGRYALPGLWDSHVHLSFLTAGGDSTVRTALQALVRRGITGVRDVGGPLDTIAALSGRVAQGRLVGPRIYYAGPLLSGPPLDSDLTQLNALLPGSAVAVTSRADVDRVLDRLARGGATMTKAFDRWDPALFRYYVGAARSRRLRVVLDPGLPILNFIPIDTALAAGVASVEHAKAVWSGVLRPELRQEVEAFMTPGVDYRSGESLMLRIMALGEQSVAPARLADIADRWARSATYYCPTLRIAESRAAGSPPEQYRQAFAGMLAVSRLFTRELANRGVKLLVGQDGADPDGTLDEIEALVRAGVPPPVVLRAATLSPAQWLGVADRFGSLDRGKTADLLILDADPLERIETIRSVWRVVYDGKLLRSRPEPDRRGDGPRAPSPNRS